MKLYNEFTIDPKDMPTAQAELNQSPTQKALRALIKRRHPDYDDMECHWEFMHDTYEGGREWFEENLFKYVKEGTNEFKERLNRAYRFNHTREVVDLVNKYLFKQTVARREDAPEVIQKFWKSSTKNNVDIDEFMRQVSLQSSIYGRVAVVVDNNKTGGNMPKVMSKADEKKMNVKVYSYIVTPEHLLDYGFDESGGLNWVLIREFKRDDETPFSSGETLERYRLWTKNDWKLYEDKKLKGGKREIVEIESGTHALGVVPIVFADNIVSQEEYAPPSLIDDIAYLDRAVANYLSNLDAIIQDQTFSQLAMPAQNVLPGEDDYNKIMEMSTKRTFLYDGEGGGQPFFLSPDPKQAQLIVEVIHKIINEIYHTVGLAGERTKQDNAVGIDNSSGVAKAYDFERVNALLASKADSLEYVENRIAYLVGLWNGEAVEQGTFVEYPDDFDTRGLYDEFDISAKLALIEAPEEVRQEQMMMLLEKLFPQMSEEKKKKFSTALKGWGKPVLTADAQNAVNTGKPSQQGQNNGQEKAPT